MARETSVPQEPLSAEDIERIANAVISAHQQTLAGLSSADQARALNWLADLLLRQKPYLWFTPAGIGGFVNGIYMDDVIRDYVQMLQFNFYMRWGAARQKFSSLIHEVSWSCAALSHKELPARRDEEPEYDTAIPKNVAGRLSNREDVLEMLETNAWMVPVLLLRSYLTVTDPVKLSQAGLSSQNAPIVIDVP